jgi:hypothetical protein
MVSGGKLTKQAGSIDTFVAVPSAYRELFSWIGKRDNVTLNDFKKQLNVSTQLAKNIAVLLEQEGVLEKRARGGWHVLESRDALTSQLTQKLEAMSLVQQQKSSLSDAPADSVREQPLSSKHQPPPSSPSAAVAETTKKQQPKKDASSSAFDFVASSPEAANAKRQQKVLNRNRAVAPKQPQQAPSGSSSPPSSPPPSHANNDTDAVAAVAGDWTLRKPGNKNAMAQMSSKMQNRLEQYEISCSQDPNVAVANVDSPMAGQSSKRKMSEPLRAIHQQQPQKKHRNH